MENIIDYSFDVDFNAAREAGLTWIPWVGIDYKQSFHKILVTAESHYANQKDAQERQIKLEDVSDDENYTRDVVNECPVNRDWNNSMFSNLHRALLTTDAIDGARLWKNLAFYNFIQRPMNYTTDWQERPNGSEFAAGWRAFIDVIAIIHPATCIFIGVTASNYFNDAMATLRIEHKKVEVIEFLNGAYLKKAAVIINGLETQIVFIRHTGKFFSWSLWHERLVNLLPGTMNNLKKLVFDDPSQIAVDNEDISFPVSARIYTHEIPCGLKHKPIIACKYSELFNEEEEDAKYISIGRAQYNDNCASVKILRHSGIRWSRQSEEVPIHRMAYMMQMFLTAILHTQQNGKDSFQSSAHEEIIAPVDMDFLKNEFNTSRKEIAEGLRAVHDLLHKIDVNKI